MAKKLRCGVFFGTRPEVIKFRPLVLAMRRRGFEVSLFRVEQQKDIIKSHLTGPFRSAKTIATLGRYDLPLMTADIMTGIKDSIDKDWDFVVVQGDTTTAFCGALVAHQMEIPVVHLEAGLRSHCLTSPFPEESYRKMIDAISTVLFPPTEDSFTSLSWPQRREGTQIAFNEGNVIIDALQDQLRSEYRKPSKRSPYAFCTFHRRENRTPSVILNFAALLKKISEHFPVLLVRHENPTLKPLYAKLEDEKRIDIIAPLERDAALKKIIEARLVITDSGGIQEESFCFQTPCVVYRTRSERPETEHYELGVVSQTSYVIDQYLEKVYNPDSRLPVKSWPSDVVPYGVYGKPGVAERMTDRLVEVFK